MILGFYHMLVALLKIYTLIEDVRITFIGGCFFLVVYWYVIIFIATMFDNALIFLFNKRKESKLK